MNIQIKEQLPRLHHVTSNDGFRQGFRYIQVKDNKAYATDAHVAIIAELSSFLSDSLPDCYILASDWKKMCVAKGAIAVSDGIIDIVSKNKTDIIRYITPDKFTHKFPDLEQVIPAKEQKETIEIKEMGFAAYVLLTFAQVMPNSRFRFTFTKPTSPVRVDCEDYSHCVYGVVMPFLLSN
jgi:DNA polymerase III sliding clamp (beta) subunit (PCNA family)